MKWIEQHARDRFLVVADGLADAVPQIDWTDLEAVRAQLPTEAGAPGRQATTIVSLPGVEEKLHLRPVRRGGWLGPLLGARLLTPAKPLRELRTTGVLFSSGVPVPAPAFVAGRRMGGFWIVTVATLHEPEARDGVAFLAANPGADEIRAAARAAGGAVRRFHEAGATHGDLHVKNILLRERATGFEAILVDLASARTGRGGLADATRMRELGRLHRSLVKRGLTAQLGAGGLAAFLRGYVDGDRALLARLLRHRGREAIRTAFHQLGYRAAP